MFEIVDKGVDGATEKSAIIGECRQAIRLYGEYYQQFGDERSRCKVDLATGLRHRLREGRTLKELYDMLAQEESDTTQTPRSNIGRAAVRSQSPRLVAA